MRTLTNAKKGNVMELFILLGVLAVFALFIWLIKGYAALMHWLLNHFANWREQRAALKAEKRV